ncbi:MAG: cytochrome c maturation protein CcmE [Amylibacter sp.]|jgi:cytochrome c-type biogenesis protein CcmE|nr:cytochrome c maturation protein CcmE [Amylibacter sp.]MDA8811188.1 cytochrome c maturation protein CcmE [Amylibacter sp.]MDB2610697.1 cytochrome c maturation protein CcmE [Amylibacter sp.]MDG2402859.1 cytochrome c maturation protein CcmE [Amylibacter sp.]|tara:strand:- start:666 stop:1100 length:435 start_codon:yes stop_codon:yes gene_type:complete
MAIGLKKRRRIQLIVIAIFFLIIATSLIGFAFKDGIEFFRSPTQVVSEEISENEIFRIGGLVKENSLIKDGDKIAFIVTDRTNDVAVKFTGILPDLFSEGTGMIATGSLKLKVFHATEILAKHDENYMPKEVADALKEQGVFQE